MDMLLGLDMLKRHQVCASRCLVLFKWMFLSLPLSANVQKSRLISGSVLIFLQCSIDLKKNVLLIGTTGTETRFLSEAELPECARLAYGAEGREDVRPDELADRELAEALQRSIQESGKKSVLSLWWFVPDLHVKLKASYSHLISCTSF